MKTKIYIYLFPIALFFIFFNGDLPKATLTKEISSYAIIPAGKVKVDKNDVELSSFYIKATEVSNKEYKDFLNDLKKQGNTKDYIIAKPDSAAWYRYISTNNLVTYKYHSNKAFDNYPVVNITKEAALMYCKWYAAKLNKDNTDKEISYICTLPSEAQWMYAAMGGNPKAMFGCKGNSIKDSTGKVIYNFNYLHKTFTPEGTLKDFSSNFILPVDRFKTNAYGLYQMSGNVAEMIYEMKDVKPTDIISAKGGSWYDSSDQLLINAHPTNQGMEKALPFVGFRPVINVVINKK